MKSRLSRLIAPCKLKYLINQALELYLGDMELGRLDLYSIMAHTTHSNVIMILLFFCCLSKNLDQVCITKVSFHQDIKDFNNVRSSKNIVYQRQMKAR
jgi:hypothetical protein